MPNRSYETPGASSSSHDSRSRPDAGSCSRSREDAPVAGGVPWLGVDSGEQLTGPDGSRGRSGATVVLGSTHGPRLMELLGAGGCC